MRWFQAARARAERLAYSRGYRDATRDALLMLRSDALANGPLSADFLSAVLADKQAGWDKQDAARGES